MRRHQNFQRLEDLGVYFPGAVDMLPEEWKSDYRLAGPRLAADAQPTLVSTPNAAIPAILTTFIDPQLLRVLLSPMAATEIFPEVRKGSYTDQTIMYPVVEHVGQVDSYDDFNAGAMSGVNMNWESRNVYNYQTGLTYGDMEMDRAALGRISIASEKRESAISTLNNYQNLTYFFGVQGLALYGILNDPALYPPLAPSLKAYGGLKWATNGSILATALEVYRDIQALVYQLISQCNGNVSEEDELILVTSPTAMLALTATNNFNVNVYTLLKENFPKMRFVRAIQYGPNSNDNNQGSSIGTVVQLIAPKVKGQDTGFCAYPEKLRAFPIVRHESSYSQKMMQGTEGAVIRIPYAISQMVGV
jgi:hypothetical protein